MIDTVTKPQPRLVKVPRKEYDALLAKAKAHDQYLAATKKMRARQAELLHPTDNTHRAICHFNDGWLDCLREFGEAVVNAGIESVLPPEQRENAAVYAAIEANE